MTPAHAQVGDHRPPRPKPLPEGSVARCVSNALMSFPTDLGESGRGLWEALSDAFDFDPQELALLEVACRQADDVSELEAVIVRDGYTVPGSAGQQRLNGAVSEVRQGRLALGRLLGQLALPNEDGRVLTAKQRQAKRAADARWSRHQARADGAA